MAEVHIFSGLGSSIFRPFQKGTRTLERMIDNLPSDVDAKHHIWSSWKSVADRLIKAKRDGTLNGPIILAGHSNGVLACCKIAEALSRNGIKVAYIGAIDPTAAAFPKIGKNVARVEEFWATSGYPKLKRLMTGNRRAACQFEPGWTGRHTLKTLKATHVGLGSHPEVTRDIYASIVACLKPIVASSG